MPPQPMIRSLLASLCLHIVLSILLYINSEQPQKTTPDTEWLALEVGGSDRIEEAPSPEPTVATPPPLPTRRPTPEISNKQTAEKAPTKPAPRAINTAVEEDADVETAKNTETAQNAGAEETPTQSVAEPPTDEEGTPTSSRETTSEDNKTNAPRSLASLNLYDSKALSGVISAESKRDLAAGGAAEDEASGPLLSRKEEKFVGFFERVRGAVSQRWKPREAVRINDPTGEQLARRDRSTTLQVTLLPSGQLHSVYIAKPSGIDYLDQEALRAFQEAAPFPAPPSQLADDDQKIRFRFQFLVAVDMTPRVKLVAE